MGENLQEQVAALRSEHKSLAQRVDELRDDLDMKHKENRKSIHDLRNNDQKIMDAIHRVELKQAKQAGWCMGAGAATALLVKLIQIAWH